MALADNPRPQYPAPAPYSPPRPSYSQPTYEDTPPVYNYQYAVQDDYAGVDFNANEGRDGYATNGAYSVLLPDGRTQTVTYTVSDAYSGFVADVQYSGQASYAPAPAPSYKPAPAPYRPAPAYPAPAPTYSA